MGIFPLMGISHLDQDHGTIMQLLDAIDPYHCNETDYTDAMLHVLDYCHRHCREEEDTMRHMNYPGTDLHIEKHKEMTDSIKENLHLTMKKEMTRADNILKNKLVICDHIINYDMAFANFCNVVNQECKED